MLKTILLRKAIALAAPLVMTVAIPWMLKDRPILLWTANRVLPVIVDAASLQPEEEPAKPKVDIRFPWLSLSVN